MTAAWLWEAGARLGVTDSEDRAKRAAETCIGAGTALVEQAFLSTGVNMEPVYERTGRIRSGQVRDGAVIWTDVARRRPAGRSAPG